MPEPVPPMFCTSTCGASTSDTRLKRVVVRPTVNSLEKPLEKFVNAWPTIWFDFSVRRNPFDVKLKVPSDREKSNASWSL